jgi:hypothetical protein
LWDDNRNGGKNMKRKTYMVFCIMMIACLPTATVQAITYENCHVIAIGRSTGLTTTGEWDNGSRYKGYLSDVMFEGCHHMVVLVIENGKIHLHFNISSIWLENTSGTFVWRVYPSYFLNIPPKTSINAEADRVYINEIMN